MAQRPFDPQYENRVVRVAELTVLKDTVDGAVFQNCQIVGPAVVAFQGCTLSSCGFDVGAGTIDSILWEVRDGSYVVGAVGFVNCEFYGCNFSRIGLAGTPEQLEVFRREISGGS